MSRAVMKGAFLIVFLELEIDEGINDLTALVTPDRNDPLITHDKGVVFLLKNVVHIDENTPIAFNKLRKMFNFLFNLPIIPIGSDGLILLGNIGVMTIG